MVQFAPTAGQKEKPKKPKKELGIGMDIAQVILPLAASVVGTPLAGAAMSALLEGAESKLEGGSWKEALTKGLVSGGIGAATGGLASGADKIAGEAFKKAASEGAGKIGSKAVTEATKGAAGSFLTQGAISNAQNIAGKTGEGLVKGLSGSLTPEASKRFTEHLASGTRDTAIDTMLAGGQQGEATAKQKFIEHVTDLGTMGLETHSAMTAEAGARRGQNEALNSQAMANRQAVMDGSRHRKQKPRYESYGGY